MSEKQLENLDLNLLLALHWLLTERNVTEAAGRLGLSQPATSRALGRLREIFEDPLLIKSGRTMLPTQKAESLQPAVGLAVERMRDVLRIADAFDPATATGSIRIACNDYMAVIVAMAWIRSVKKEAPGLDLSLVDLSFAAARDMISGKIDMVILPDLAMTMATIPAHFDIEQFVQKEIFTEPWRCAIRKNHPLANQKLTLEQFAGLEHILINPEEQEHGIVDKLLAEKGLKRRIAYRTANFLSVLPLIVKTDCIITAPARLFDLYAKDLIVFESPLEMESMKIFGGWHPNWTHDVRHKWVRSKAVCRTRDPKKLAAGARRERGGVQLLLWPPL